MKTMKRLFVLLLSLAILLALFACGGDSTCTSHTDADNNGKCDTCGETVETNNNENNNNTSSLPLIENGQFKFQFVYASNVGGGVMMTINQLQMAVQTAGGSLDIVDDKAATIKDVEVLIGDTTSRGEEYAYDKYSLGEKGYIIKTIGNKIIINAGSTDTLVDAVEIFIKDILDINMKSGKIGEIKDVTMTSDKDVVKIQDDYRITSIKVNGEEINGYTIAIDSTNAAHQSAASSLNKFLYSSAGYYLPIVKLENAGDKVITIEAVDYAGEDGFLVTTDDSGALRIQCAYANAFESAFTTFFTNELRLKTGDIDFSKSYTYTDEISVVYYDDYLHLSQNGNDYLAIKAAHDFANIGGQTVKANRGKTYTITHLGSINADGTINYTGSITIKTNVDWGNANIRFDDTCMDSDSSHDNNNVFVVASDYSSITLTKTAREEEINKLFPGNVIDADTCTQVGGWEDYGYKALIVAYNDNHKVYIRTGGDANNGSPQHELILVDENGVIDPTTYYLLDYEEITKVLIQRVDETPLLITGGKFTTIANDTPLVADKNGKFPVTYFQRGISVTRSNVTMKGVEHRITNEIPDGPTSLTKGPSYSGFFTSGLATNVLYEDCILTAHRYYSVCGTYDFSATMTNNIYLKNCKQTNFYILDANGKPTTTNSMDGSMYWGVGGTNFCKNMVYDGCELTRFDAHQGLYNGKIINTKISAINLIGGGDMLIENCDIEILSNGNVITLRHDYGSTWNGTITLKDCRIKIRNSDCTLASGTYTNHYYGYLCHVPSIVASGLKFYDYRGTLLTSTTVFVYKRVISQPEAYVPSDSNLNVLQPPKTIKIEPTVGYNYTYIVYYTPFFQGTTIEGSSIEYRN